MRTVVTVVATALLVVTTLFGMPSRAQSQVIVIIGNGSAQPYYPPPPPYQYPTPYPNPQVAYGGGYYYPGYLASQYGYNHSYYNGYHGVGFSRPYEYGW